MTDETRDTFDKVVGLIDGLPGVHKARKTA